MMKIGFKRLVLLFYLSLFFSGITFGQESIVPKDIVSEDVVPKKIEIWGEEAPYQSNSKSVVLPYLTYFSAKGEGLHTAVIICPGGGYRTLAMEREGFRTARAFNRKGISAFVLRYRLGSEGYRHPAMIADLQQSIALLRQNASLWSIDPNKIGVIGFSAGGHLAATGSVLFNMNYTTLSDSSSKKYNVRPDFVVLCYPVITMDSEWTHFGSKFKLLGMNPSPDLVDMLSCEKQINKNTPPVFLVHAQDDIVVPIENSEIFYEKLQEQDISSQFFVYKRGGHGFGVKKHEWFDRCVDWLSEIGIKESSP